jgi:hypothetical protein
MRPSRSTWKLSAAMPFPTQKGRTIATEIEIGDKLQTSENASEPGAANRVRRANSAMESFFSAVRLICCSQEFTPVAEGHFLFENLLFRKIRHLHGTLPKAAPGLG